MKQYFYKSILTIFATLFLINFTMGQAILKGEVLDERDGEPLIGANVLIKGTSEGATTDYDGKFQLKTDQTFPLTLLVSYIGYTDKELELTAAADDIEVKLGENSIITDVIEVTGQRISDKQKAAPLTVESMDILAIKETPSDNFYDGLGSLKGVDLTAASLGFKIINTRGFNSTSPVRSLQIIDGVDNQAPGLNFSLGNFLGSSELDVLKVDLIVGASSAFYGPNAFNGVISMETKNPFLQKGLSGIVKVGERNLLETAVRYANSIRNRDSLEFFAYKINFSYMQADDWEAENYDAVYDTDTDVNNPGGYDAVNIYGDEYFPANDFSGTAPWKEDAALGIFHRTGYKEKDLVDYNTRNYKANVAFHFRTNPKLEYESPEFIISSSFGSGTTVYQGDNRFSLRNILFFQNRLEFRKKDKWFVRAYATHENAGDSFDPYFTALKLQERAKTDDIWASDYREFWLNSNFYDIAIETGYPELDFSTIPPTFDYDAAETWLAENQALLVEWHRLSADHTNLQSTPPAGTSDFLVPGSPLFQQQFDEITAGKSNDEENGTRFYDKSALYHLHGEYIFETDVIDHITVGANGRYYTPNSDGTIFYDTADTKINTWEAGAYVGLDKEFYDKKLRGSVTVRLDKHENFDLAVTPAVSLVWKPRPNNYLRASFSAAIRNPTLSDQYLNFNVGPAKLAGNLNGVDSLIDPELFNDYLNTSIIVPLEYFSIDPVQPEKVKTFEVGYRTTILNKLYIDAGYYYSIYDDFLGYKIGIDVDIDNLGNPFLKTLQVYRYAANSTEQVTTQGFSIGLNYYFWRNYQVSGNYSWNKLITEVDDSIVPAFNTPEHKFNVGVSGRDITIPMGSRNLRGLGFNVNYKWIDGFLFEGSPQFTGFVPSYSMLDAQINIKVNKIKTTFKLGASNLLNNKKFQTYGGPRIGRLAYFSMLYEFKA